MSDGSALEIISAYQDAWTAKDFATAGRYLAPDVVFQSSGQQHLTTSGDVLTMLAAFAERIEPRWEKVAAVEDARGVLVLYKLFTGTGAPALCADYFAVEENKIQSESLVFDPEPFLVGRK
ncbi:MAG: nuclear transport factor 2 family protein [Candidatus Dormibacteraeota bacterium]|uniref:Nuclear transport factor 2 family protein n=1 Tax=Candidatus Dormiibacter inghamiae TaxID=3127013 RepID=A0A934K882_9BACT|nr:nuclear transport factor 2 family protein [Candidatus Dormibacteraeota bacterium]MBJ7604885.1 nuclear transport factor 2 family protein [Candidatus Dormibacteraeota bacterium]